jgi:ElaB/YqjD/DUF883 family membrane-anchored ribosome-binding protein
MDETNRTDAPKPGMASAAQGSGSDTVSAAKISAGTSVGSVGQPARPQEFGSRTTTPGSGYQTSSQSSQGQGGAGSTASDLRNRASDAVEQTSEWARDQYERGSRQLDWARDQSMQQYRQARVGIDRFVSENPLMVGVIGLAAGLVIGALLPRTRQEDRAFGQWADQVRDQGMRYAREAAQRGREYVEGALGDTGDSEDEWRPDENRGGPIRSSGPRYQNH